VVAHQVAGEADSKEAQPMFGWASGGRTV